MSDSAPKVQDQKEDPLRNVTSEELVAITQHRLFAPPEDVDSTAWTTTILEVRDAIEKLKIDIPCYRDERAPITLRNNVCPRIEKMVRDNKLGIDPKRLTDPLVDFIRKEIWHFLNIRIRIGSRNDLGVLVDYAKEHGGVINIRDFKTPKTDRDALRRALSGIASNFGDTEERKRLAYDLMAEYLTGVAGFQITFNNRFIDRRRDGQTEDSHEEPVTGDSPIISQVKRELGFVTGNYADGLRRICAAIDSRVLDVEKEINKMQEPRDILNLQLQELENQLEPYRRSKAVLQARKDTATDNAKSDGRKSLLLKDQKQFSRDFRALEEQYKTQLEALEKLLEEINPLDKKLEKLQREKSDLEILKANAQKEINRIGGDAQEMAPAAPEAYKAEQIKVETLEQLRGLEGKEVLFKINSRNDAIMIQRRSITTTLPETGAVFRFKVVKIDKGRDFETIAIQSLDNGNVRIPILEEEALIKWHLIYI